MPLRFSAEIACERAPPPIHTCCGRAGAVCAVLRSDVTRGVTPMTQTHRQTIYHGHGRLCTHRRRIHWTEIALAMRCGGSFDTA
eukprot:4821981-Prymnesium_polylepis.1